MWRAGANKICGQAGWTQQVGGWVTHGGQRPMGSLERQVKTWRVRRRAEWPPADNKLTIVPLATDTSTRYLQGWHSNVRFRSQGRKEGVWNHTFYMFKAAFGISIHVCSKKRQEKHINKSNSACVYALQNTLYKTQIQSKYCYFETITPRPLWKGSCKNYSF